MESITRKEMRHFMTIPQGRKNGIVQKEKSG
jgi:hypothetical protein